MDIYNRHGRSKWFLGFGFAVALSCSSSSQRLLAPEAPLSIKRPWISSHGTGRPSRSQTRTFTSSNPRAREWPGPPSTNVTLFKDYLPPAVHGHSHAARYPGQRIVEASRGTTTRNGSWGK